MIGAIGDFLPLAMAVALSPFPIIAVVMVLGGADSGRAGPAFVIGWLAGLGLITLAFVFAAGGAAEASFGLGAGTQVLLGLGLLAAAARKWRARPRGGVEPPLPGWAAALDRASPGRAALIGLVLGGPNPKNLALTLAAAALIAERGLTGRSALVAGAVYVALASSGVLAAFVLRQVGGVAGARRLEAVRRFMLRNNNVIVMILLIVIGTKVLGDGLAAFGAPG